MVLDSQRKKIDPVLSFIAKFFSKINPDLLTWISLLFAFISGLFFFFSSPGRELMNYYLFFGSLFVFLNGLFDALDGKVAKMRNKDSRRGDFLDHAFDRFSDVLIVGGIALGPWCQDWLGVVAIAGVLLTSYMGTQSQAVGFQRTYSGFLGRADRLVFLMLVPIVQHILIHVNLEIIYGFYLMEWILIYFAFMGNLTAVQRFFKTMRWFKKNR
ncbi:MAG: CDP-alcohol phosphatidyltransferase family protein [Candidatus Thermoplasmatota archaeon]